MKTETFNYNHLNAFQYVRILLIITWNIAFMHALSNIHTQWYRLLDNVLLTAQQGIKLLIYSVLPRVS